MTSGFKSQKSRDSTQVTPSSVAAAETLLSLKDDCPSEPSSKKQKTESASKTTLTAAERKSRDKINHFVLLETPFLKKLDAAHREYKKLHHKGGFKYVDLSKSMREFKDFSVDLDSKYLRGVFRGAHYAFRLVVTGALTADGTGVVATSLGLNPSTYSEWTSVAALFDEFRVLHGTFHFTPTNRYNRASTDVVRAVDVVFDNDNAPTLASYNDAAEYANVKQEGQSDPYKYHFVRPDITASAYWVDVSSPASSAGAVALYSAGNTNSIALGIYMMEIFVEMRQRV
jgi:hypothetical protein